MPSATTTQIDINEVKAVVDAAIEELQTQLREVNRQVRHLRVLTTPILKLTTCLRSGQTPSSHTKSIMPTTQSATSSSLKAFKLHVMPLAWRQRLKPAAAAVAPKTVL